MGLRSELATPESLELTENTDKLEGSRKNVVEQEKRHENEKQREAMSRESRDFGSAGLMVEHARLAWFRV
jgi:hypothetical protein